MISYANHKEPARMLKLAVIDDVTPAKKGDVLEYYRGCTDFEPTGARLDVFRSARALMDKGRVRLFQKRYGKDDYGYWAVVV